MHSLEGQKRGSGARGVQIVVRAVLEDVLTWADFARLINSFHRVVSHLEVSIDSEKMSQDIMTCWAHGWLKPQTPIDIALLTALFYCRASSQTYVVISSTHIIHANFYIQVHIHAKLTALGSSGAGSPGGWFRPSLRARADKTSPELPNQQSFSGRLD